MRAAELEFEKARIQYEQGEIRDRSGSGLGVLVVGTISWLIVLIAQSVMGAGIVEIFVSGLVASVLSMTVVIIMQIFRDSRYRSKRGNTVK